MSLEKIIELQKARMGVYGTGNQDALIDTTFGDFEENPAYRLVQHNDKSVGVHFLTKTGKLRHQEIYTITKPPHQMNTGDYILDEHGVLWMCYSVMNFPIRKHYMDVCNHELKWIDFENNLITKKSITSAKTLYTTGIKDEKVIEIPNGMMGIQLPYDEDTKKIDRKQSFILNKTKYEVTFYNEIEFPGLVLLICTEVGTSTYDDKINEIADRWVEVKGGGKIDRLPWLDDQEPPIEPEPPTEPVIGVRYTLSTETPFQDDDPNELWYGETYKYIMHKFVDDVEVSGNFTFEISDVAKVTLSNVNNSDCKVTAKDIKGNYIIKLTVTDIDTSTIAIERTINIRGR